MTHARYEAAETLVYDPVASNRNATRAALRSLGFRSVEFASTLDALRACLIARSPDLLLCEVGSAEAEVCALVQSIRQGNLGNDPFTVVIVTTWRRDGSIVNRAINSGADDLLARPFSAAVLGERLKLQIERRKGFVVTGDYVGPDRRHDESRAGALCIEVPNALRMKTALGLSTLEAEQRIAALLREGKREVNAEKLRRDALLLCAQWQVLEQRQPGGRDFAAVLARMVSLSSEIERRTPDTPHSAAAEWCRALREGAQSATAALSAGPDEAPARLSLALQEIGLAVLELGRTVASTDGDASHLASIEAKLAHAEARPMAGRTVPGQPSAPGQDRRATAGGA